MVVLALANKHTWKPGRAVTFDCSARTLQELPPLDEPAEALLLLLPLEQAATTSPSAAAAAADVVTLPIVLTRSTPS
jgi:hypothetical protein